MPIVDHNKSPETPWRPNYRKWDITREGDHTTFLKGEPQEAHR